MIPGIRAKSGKRSPEFLRGKDKYTERSDKHRHYPSKLMTGGSIP